MRKGSIVDFVEKPIEITSENSSSAPDGDKAPEKSVLKQIVSDGVISESPKGTPMQSTTQLNGNDPEALNKSVTI